MLWVRHTHEDRVELYFCTPRLELTSGRSLNIAPPGYQNAFDRLRDVMNQRHSWADPMELERTLEVRDTMEAPTRAQGRDELHSWLQDQISVGLITDRASMIDALADAGFDLPGVGKAYLTVKDPDTGERWRLKGEIFHENWQADPVEREAERGTGHDPAGLDLLCATALLLEHVGASMASQLESFRTDLSKVATNAQRTIEIGTRTFLRQNKSWLTISPWLIMGTFLTGIAVMMVASWLWTVQLTRSELTELGLTRIDSEDATWLVLDPAKTRLGTCTLGGRPVTCIKIEEN